MRIIAVTNDKGGSCKTTITINVAAELAARGQRVLVIDLDESANATEGLGHPAEAAFTVLANAMIKPDATLETIRKGIVKIEAPWGVDLLPSGDHQAIIVSDKMLERRGGIGWFRCIRELVEYDVILLDLPARAANLGKMALIAATEVLIPAEIKSADAAKGLAKVWSRVAQCQEGPNPELVITGIVLARYDRTRATKWIRDELLEHPQLGPKILRLDGEPYILSEWTDVAQARSHRRPVREYAPSTKASANFSGLTDALMEAWNV